MKNPRILFLIMAVTMIHYGYSQELASTVEIKKITADAAIPDDFPTETTEKKADEEEDKNGKFTYSGYFDTYYFANLNKPASRNNLGASGIARGFDRNVGQFQLGMFLNRVSYAYKKTEVVGEIGFGPNAE